MLLLELMSTTIDIELL